MKMAMKRTTPAMTLLEVGRVLSKANETALKAAMDQIMKVMASLNVQEAERSGSDKQKLLLRALRIKMSAMSPDGMTPYCYIADIFDTFFVHTSNDKFFRSDYSIADDGTVTLGEPVEVIPRTEYLDADTGLEYGATPGVQECALDEVGLVDLIEAANLTEATARIKLIQPGWGSSGYYSPALLKRDGPGVFRKGTQMFWDHQTAAEESSKPEGSLDRLAGELIEDAKWGEDNGPGLYARAKIFDQFKSPVKELAPHIGVSIRGTGMSERGEAEGRQGKIISKLADAKSVDFVTRAGAGGKVLQLFEAAGHRSLAEPETAVEEAGRPEEQKENSKMAENDTEIKRLQEAVATGAAEMARLRESIAARQFVVETLDQMKTLEPVRHRLIEGLVAKAVFADGKLDDVETRRRIDEAVKAELAYIAKVTPTNGHVKGMGGSAQADDEKSLAEARKRTADNLAALTGVPAEKFMGRVA